MENARKNRLSCLSLSRARCMRATVIRHHYPSVYVFYVHVYKFSWLWLFAKWMASVRTVCSTVLCAVCVPFHRAERELAILKVGAPISSPIGIVRQIPLRTPQCHRISYIVYILFELPPTDCQRTIFLLLM